MGMAAARKQEVSLTAVLLKKEEKKKWAGSWELTPGEDLHAAIDSPSLQSLSLPFSLSTDCNKKYSSEESLVAVLSVYSLLHCSLQWSLPPLQRVWLQRAGSCFLCSLFHLDPIWERRNHRVSLGPYGCKWMCVCHCACVRVCVCVSVWLCAM